MKFMTLSVVLASALVLSSCGIFKKSTQVVAAEGSSAKVETVANTTANKTTKTKKKSKKKTIKIDVSQATSTAEQVVAVTPEQLEGEWTVSIVNGEKVTGDERPFIYFETAQSRFYGNGGCNVINGSFELDGNKLVFTDMLSSMRMCENAPFEYQINYALSQAATCKIVQKGNETYLSLFDSAKTQIMELRKHNMDYLSGVWQIVGVSGEECDDEALKLVIDIPEMRLHGNVGCNIVNGMLLIDADKSNSIQFMQLITTMKSCPDQEREMAILIALEEVEQAQPVSDEMVVLADKNGKELLKLRKIEVK